MLAVAGAVAGCAGTSPRHTAGVLTTTNTQPSLHKVAYRRAFAVEASLGTLYNVVYKRRGAQSAMRVIVERAKRSLRLVDPSQRVRFARDLIRWADGMAGNNSRLNGQYERLVEAFGPRTGDVVASGGLWEWSTPYAVSRVNDYDWSNKPAKNTSCVGIWNEGAVRVRRVGYFAAFRCEFWQASGWSNFVLRAKSATDFSTGHWADGQIGASPSGGTDHSGAGCATQSGTAFHNLVGVSCNEAINVWYGYTQGDGLPDGWSCSPNKCTGSPDVTGLSVSFTWSP